MSAQHANINLQKREEMSLVDRLCADALAGQAAILEDQLKAGFPLVYQDAKGNLVQKNPDGTVTAYGKPE